MNICLRVLKETNKSRYDTYSMKGVPLCEICVHLKAIPSRKLQRGNRSRVRHNIPNWVLRRRKEKVLHIIRDPAC